MLNNEIKTLIESLLNKGKKVQLEYNDKTNEVKLLEITVKKIKL